MDLLRCFQKDSEKTSSSLLNEFPDAANLENNFRQSGSADRSLKGIPTGNQSISTRNHIIMTNGQMIDDRMTTNHVQNVRRSS